MELLDNIKQLEEAISKLKAEREEESASYEALKAEFRTMIDRFNAQSRRSKEKDEYFLGCIGVLQRELETLKKECGIETPKEAVAEPEVPLVKEPVATATETVNPQERVKTERVADVAQTQPEQQPIVRREASKKKERKVPAFDLEKFVGENLISKLGILILLVGVAIGGHYAIANDLISPTLRIVLGYVVAFVLQGFAFKLKKDYKPFSAVLSSGSLAIMYFMTYFAYGFYGLISMPFAFVLMMLITVCTVYSAWWYNMQIIAIIGQVGAYVIPFLVSSGNGNIYVLLTYVALINLGVMVVSIKKYWRMLFGFSFVSTWGLVMVVYASKHLSFLQTADSVKMLAFVLVFFVLFYATFLANKLVNNRVFSQFDVYFLLVNSFVFYGLGFRLLAHPETLQAYHGVFTLCNALLHLGVVVVISKRKLFDDALRMLIMGLVVLFITLAILVWFSGHWITMFWMLEAAVLFTVARTKQVAFYERLAYPLFIFALLSLFADWGNPSGTYDSFFACFYEVFHHMRELWDSRFTVVQSSVLSYINTIFFLLVGGWVLYTDIRRPANYNLAFLSHEQLSKVLRLGMVSVVTMAIYVYFSVHVCAMLWAIETLLIYYLVWKKDVEKGEVLVACLLALTTCAFMVVISKYMEGWLGFSAELNVTTAIFVLCVGGLLYIARLRKQDGVFADAVVWVLLFAPIAALIDNYCILLNKWVDCELHGSFILAFLLTYFSVLYFFAHRFSWKGFPVKLMLLLRVMVVVSVTLGLLKLKSYRELYQSVSVSLDGGYQIEYGSIPTAYFVARYFMMVVLAFSLYLLFIYRKSAYRLIKAFTESQHKLILDTFMVVVVICMLSSELLNICDFMDYASSFKLLMSILWAVCALVLIYLGLVKNMKYIRIEGIALFFVTLMKLFFIDIWHLDMLSKMIVLVAIGALLIVGSFFYMKIAKQQEKLNAEEHNADAEEMEQEEESQA